MRTLVCAGHPRDMGLAQGRALAPDIRAELLRRGLPIERSRWPSLRPLVSGSLRGRGAGRELFRHFAHQAERLEGLAQAAGLSLDGMLALQLGFRREACVEGWILRESRPVVGFASLEVALPGLVPAIAGINDAGLVLVSSSPQKASDPDALAGPGARADAGPRTPAPVHAPPILLVQDCLARFENLEGALDWCRKRPVEGELGLELADATGQTARIVFAGRERSIERGSPAGGSRLGCRVRGASEESVWARFDPQERGIRLEADPREGSSSRIREWKLVPGAKAE